MNFSIDEITRMAKYIKYNGTYSEIRNYFACYTVQSDLESIKSLNKFNCLRNDFYLRFESLFTAMIVED